VLRHGDRRWIVGPGGDTYASLIIKQEV